MLGSVSNKKRKKKQKKLQARLQKCAVEAKMDSKQLVGDEGADMSDDDDDDEALPDLNDRGFDEGDLGFTASDLDACTRVLNSLSSRLSDFKSAPFRELRGALHPLIEEQMKNYDFKSSVGNKRRKRDVAEEQAVPSLKELDKQWRNKTALRSKRLAALEELNAANGTIMGPDDKPLLLTHKGEVEEALVRLREKQGAIVVQRVPDGVAELAEDEEEAAKAQKTKLNIPISCYICKRPFVDLHFFYDQLCPACAELNYRKRNEVVDMKGCVALVTGARVKIGYRCALKLLRCGCTVIATSRFATDCARRFAKEQDSDEWIGRLQCYGIDFRDLASLELFCEWVKQKHTRLDAIVNNACQTIRRPAQYYSHLMDQERTPTTELPPKVMGLLEGNEAFRGKMGVEYLQAPDDTKLPGINCTPKATVKEVDGVEGVEDEADLHQSKAKVGESSRGVQGRTEKDEAGDEGGSNGASRSGLSVKEGGCSSSANKRRSAAEMSQMVVIEEDADRNMKAFPERAGGGAVLDVNEQQVDLRRHNSWVLKLHEVSTGELAEVMAINAIAPAVLNARLKPLLVASPARFKFIVNVSAMEGKFYRWKSEHHPHTNMAKAALNMMTRTSAQDYVKAGIYMTAVDTGWINDEKPIEVAVKHEQDHNFQTPLDEVDAAARVLDPIIAPLIAASKGEDVTPHYGVFLKDFVKCEW